MLFTLDSIKLLGFSDFIPANSDADWTTWEDWGSGGGVCVVRAGGGVKPFQNLRVRGQSMPSLAHTCICLVYRSLFSRLSH